MRLFRSTLRLPRSPTPSRVTTNACQPRHRAAELLPVDACWRSAVINRKSSKSPRIRDVFRIRRSHPKTPHTENKSSQTPCFAASRNEFRREFDRFRAFIATHFHTLSPAPSPASLRRGATRACRAKPKSRHLTKKVDCFATELFRARSVSTCVPPAPRLASEALGAGLSIGAEWWHNGRPNTVPETIANSVGCQAGIA
jgi:hypothetical protein